MSLVACSPPFIALRSYLPADHPDQSFYLGKRYSAIYYAQNVLPTVATKGALIGREDRSSIEIPASAFATV